MLANATKFIEFMRKSAQFIIPIYQRTYSWTRPQRDLIGSDLKIAILEPKEGRMAVNLCVGMNWLNGGGHSPPYGTPVFTAVNGDGFTFRGVAI